MFIHIVFIILGLILLIKGADLLVTGSSGIAKKFDIPEIIVGLTIVSIGTSMPELFVSVKSAMFGFSDLSLGNIIGSNLCNLLLILGISAIIRPVAFKKETKFVDVPMCLFVTVLFMFFCNLGGSVNFTDGLILFALFLLFLLYNIVVGKKLSNDSKDKSEKKISVPKCILSIVVGIVALKYGGDFVVDHATVIANMLNISEKIIGLTIVAIGTSLPELVTSVTASLKGNPDIAIGNIIGSNISNILLIGGLSAMISPITFNTSYNLQLIILIVATIILGIFPYTDKKDEMTVSNGLTYVAIYILYMVLLFFR